MKHLFVPYEIAKQLKDKGFNEPCIGSYESREDKVTLHLDELYNSSYTRFLDERHYRLCVPFYQQVIDWFREKYEIAIIVEPTFSKDKNLTEYSFQLVGLNIRGRSSSENYLHVVPLNHDSCKLFPTNTRRTILESCRGNYYEVLDKAIEEALKLI